MNQGRIWCVVNPTVGLPLFLGGVAAISLIVHGAVLSNTTWMSAFFNGGAPAKAALNDTVSPVAMATPDGAGFAITVAPAAKPDANGATAFVVTVTPTGANVASSAAAPDTLAMAVPSTQ
jgi:light-harvesting protein B-800-850 alpha chain